MKKLILLSILSVGAAAVTLSARGSPARADGEGDQGKRVDELLAAVAALRKQVNQVTDSTGWLAADSPPIGSIVAFYGQWEAGGDYEGKFGWLLCDGRDDLPTRDYPELARLLGYQGKERFTLPKLQGQFLRGLDKTGAIDKYGSVRSIGSIERYATALPVNDFVITGGAHSHEYTFLPPIHTAPDNKGDTDRAVRSNPPPPAARTSESKSHTHYCGARSATGGDPETRPTNVAVHWIIKAQREPR